MPNMMDKLSEDMKNAMKNKDQLRLEALRMMKSKLMSADTKGEFNEQEELKVLAKYAKTLKETLAIAQQHNKGEVVEQTKKELAVVQEFLPAELTEAQVKAKVLEIIAGLGEVTMKDIGKVMKECMANIQGVDGSVVKKFVAEVLK